MYHIKSHKNKIRRFAKYTVLLLIVLIQLMLCSAKAQEMDALNGAAARLEQARFELKEIQTRLSESDRTLSDPQLLDLRNRLFAIQSQAGAIDESFSPALVGVQARLAELGQSDPEEVEDEDVKKQREALTSEAATISNQLKITRLIAVEAEQALEDLSNRRREQFQAVISQRGLSPFSPSLWSQLQIKLPEDLAALSLRFNKFNESLTEVSVGVKTFFTVMAMAWVMGCLYAWKLFIRFLLTRSQPTRLRRSLLATMLVGVYVFIPTGMLLILFSIMNRVQGLSQELEVFLQQFIGVVALVSFMAGLGRALLAPNKPSWRLPNLPNAVAKSLQWLPVVLSTVVLTLWTLQQLTHVVSSSISTVLLTNGLFALGLNLVVGLAAWRAQRHYMKEGQLTLATPLATSLHGLALKLVLVAVVLSLFALIVGYTALSNLIIQEVVWLALVVFTTYLLFSLIGDVANAALSRFKESQRAQQLTESQGRVRSQIMLLFAGALKILLLLVALTLFFLPFGEDPMVWLHRRLAFLLQGFTFGEVTLKPAAFLYGVIVLVVGTWVVQSLQNWLAERYLPHTRLDPGMRSSAARLVSYVGYVVAGVMALSAAGIGFDRMAWIVSALSVGIGFGLQAVVQNFVSGLLLLAERPIKVGDWVSLGTVEGNVRRINARATEIEMFDRSTVIVPNSEFITKVVRNVTLSDPLGRGRITVVMPVNAKASVVRQCLLDAVESTDEVLTEPNPSVIIDGFESGGIAFSLYFFVASPRLVNSIRSQVFFKVLENFEKISLALHPTQRMELVEATNA